MTSGYEHLTRLGNQVRDDFTKNRRVMSFAEYLDLAQRAPRTQLRSAPQYLVDCFLHYGTEEVEYPRGKLRRFKLFDCPWADGRERLCGHEVVQNRLYRALENFVHEGTANRLVLLHGPNGSAKSTLVRCIGRALQHYSTLDEGALYRINWIFPTRKLSRGDIGFAAREHGAKGDSFAYLADELIDTKLADELRDHPLLLIPPESRLPLMQQMLAGAPEGATAADEFRLSDYLRFGRLSPKNRAIYEALLTSYQGDYLAVLRHVQVERFYIQHRYREGYVTVEPQLSVDASERQVTADRSLAALPAALQSVSLYEYGGELVCANRGLIEYSDLLKRPLEAYKYLLSTVERATIQLANANVFLDMVFVATSNEIHLDVFKKTAEFLSFKGRLELVRVPYLRSFQVEQEIYEDRIREAAGARHVAPHCAFVAALWAVLTRLRRPSTADLPASLHASIARLTPLEKAEMYAFGRIPERFGPAEARTMAAHIDALMEQTGESADYEGRVGASPRELLGAIFNAAHSTRYSYVSPLAIIDELRDLIRQTSVYPFLALEAEEGGYRDPAMFIDLCLEKLVARTDDEVRQALGLVAESEYERVFERYVNHVMYWTKHEKIRNPLTGRFEDADENLMRGVEQTLGIKDQERSDHRRDLIARIGAWSLDHLGEKPDYNRIFGKHFKRLSDDYFEERKKVVRRGIEGLLAWLTEQRSKLDATEKERAQTTLARLIDDFGYSEDSARDAVSLLYRRRYQ